MITAKKKSLLFCKELEGIFCIIYTVYCIHMFLTVRKYIQFKNNLTLDKE